MFRRAFLGNLQHPFFKPKFFSTQQRPHVFFAKNYYDPATSRVLISLLPSFNRMGYKKFLDQVPPKFSIQSHIKYCNESISKYRVLEEDFEVRRSIDTINKNGVKKIDNK